MSINDITVCTDKKEFNPRGEWDLACKDNEHDWRVLVFCEGESPNLSVAICTLCARLAGGWSKSVGSFTDD